MTGEKDRFEMQMPFGKYRGCDLTEIPLEYHQWLWENVDLRGDLKREVHYFLFERFKMARVETFEPDRIKTVYRELSRKYHPDHGGDHLAMCAVNDFYSLLMEA